MIVANINLYINLGGDLYYMKNQIMLEAEKLQEELTAWRRGLHQIPEIGLALPETVAFVTEKLREMGIQLARRRLL